MSHGLHHARPRTFWGMLDDPLPQGSWFDRPVQFRGQAYGRPDVTVLGPQIAGLEMQFVGVIASEEAGDAIAAETLLRITERLAVQAPIASGHVLRILPLASELNPESEDRADLAGSEPLDGLIQLRLGPGIAPRLSGEGPPPFLQAARFGQETLRRLGSEDAGGGLILEGECAPSLEPWRLGLELPRAWSAAVALHWSSQFFVSFFRAHAEHLQLAGTDDQI